MSDPHAEPEEEQKRSLTRVISGKIGTKLGGFLKDGALKGRAQLEHALGLGPLPNVIPPAEADIHGEQRLVEIGWHPVLGFGGKWFAEKTGLGKTITKTINKYPDPSQHWAVLVDNYAHQLWMDEHLDIIYINEEVNKQDWHTFPVGKTRFNDEALRQASEMAIFKMRRVRASYNLISNNCQNFALNLLDAIQIGAHKEFATSFEVFQKATGKGAIKDLFVDKHPEEQQPDHQSLEEMEAAPGRLHRQDTVLNAQQVMQQNTTQLDNHHHMPAQ